MLFDIDEGRSLEDIIQRMWDHEWSQSFQGRVLAAGEAQGCQWFDVGDERDGGCAGSQGGGSRRVCPHHGQVACSINPLRTRSDSWRDRVYWTQWPGPSLRQQHTRGQSLPLSRCTESGHDED